jgi:zinc resistance-associated protein
MWKAIVVAATAAFAIASTSLVYGQQSGRPDGGQRWRLGAEDLRAFGEARLAALKAGLMLTPEQARSWQAFEQAARDFGKLRMDRRLAMHSTPPAYDPVERMRRRATAMSEMGAALEKLADAAEPLYTSLDDNQKQRFRSTQSPDGDQPGSFPPPRGRRVIPLGSTPERGWDRPL